MDIFTNIANSAAANFTSSTIIYGIKTLAEETIQIYVNAECNKETSLIMKNRVENAKKIIEEFIRHDNENFNRRKFIAVLEVLKQLTEDYETCIKELLLHSAHYIQTMTLKKKNLGKSIKKLKKYRPVKIFDALLIQKIAKQSGDIHVKKIGPNELTDPFVPPKKNIHKNFIKKFYRTIEVECKNFQDSEDFRRHLAILEKLDHPYIRRFYGLSYADIREVMVFEWSEYGSLKDLYNAYNIPWTRKIQIIRDICHIKDLGRTRKTH
ncbi:11204_t:CDS:2 [Dentiscutata heterogama]|uniref:11204_t:CDS:1 n=1 Tax=Dentiscutata heterogama TaxID=1316150 RepID=A0ACA9L5K9_9GLOM|nr:11204_t:CDS:2 [Dentiscutata heterogama]